MSSDNVSGKTTLVSKNSKSSRFSKKLEEVMDSPEKKANIIYEENQNLDYRDYSDRYCGRCNPCDEYDESFFIEQRLLVSLYLTTKINKESKIFHLPIQVNNFITISELIVEGVKCYNKYFDKESLNIDLAGNYSNYSLRYCKKSGKPDFDLPKFDRSSTIKETNNSRFSLDYKFEDLKIVKKSTGKCKNCIIF